MRLPLVIASLVLAAPALAGEPVLLPDFQPAGDAEAALTGILHERVAAALSGEGHIVLDAAAARPVVGDTLGGCWDAPGCPFAALQQLPGRVAIVAKIALEEGTLKAFVAVYEQSDSQPVQTREFPVPPGSEDRFAADVAAMTTDILSLLGPSPSADLMEAMKLVEAAHAPPAPDPEPAPVPDPVPVPTPEPVHVELTLDQILAGTGVRKRHLAGSQQAFLDSELDPRDWIYKAMPHAGRVVIEVRGGYGLGDQDRWADVRVTLADGGGDPAEWWQEGPCTLEASCASGRVRGGLFVGYAPVTFFDFGVLVGLQYGQKHLTTGWRRADGGGGQTSSEDVVQAVQVYVQPRARFYLAPTGPAKPFLVVGPELRYFDPYHIVDPATVDYPDPWGGIVPGATAGGGLIIDPSPLAGFFAEGTYTQHFGIRSIAAENGTEPAGSPDPPRGRGYTIAVIGGVQFRI